MRRRSAWLAIPVLALLAGCAAVDSFSSRAFNYNRQASSIQEQQLLLNVMRAAYRAPLQFTTFTQITGQASISGTAAFTLPFNPSPSTFGHADTAVPSATVSGNQAFTVANLDTQEFYQGILSPIPTTTIDYYIEQGFPETVLLTLMASRLGFTINGEPPKSFYNDFYHTTFSQFEQALYGLVSLGLSTETVRNVESIGPPVTASELPELRALSPLISSDTALRRFTPGTDSDLTPAEQAQLSREHTSEYFRLQTTSETSRFCFSPELRNFSNASKALTKAGVLQPGATITGFANTLTTEAEQCGAKGSLRRKAEERKGYAAPKPTLDLEVREPDGETRTISLGLTYTVRSTEGVIYYLGEIARGELGIGVPHPRPPPLITTALGNDQLFMVQHACDATSPEIAIGYADARYCVGIDPSGADRSAEVMQIVLQLIALNNSAKNLPAPSVLSIVSP